jgi:catechol 2,3-dioxygenase-like lactoylglutathione lyase family enzyme
MPTKKRAKSTLRTNTNTRRHRDAKLNVENAIPVLAVADVPASIGFYRKILGFKLDWGGDGEVSHIAQVSRDGHAIMLQRRRPVTRSCVWIGLSVMAPLWKKIRSSRDVEIVERPTNQPWALEMKIADPDGNVL